RARIGNRQHVAVVDRLPSPDARSIETGPILKNLLGEFVDRRGKMLPDARKVDELKVDHLRFVLLCKLQYLFRCHAFSFPLFPAPVSNPRAPEIFLSIFTSELRCFSTW